MYTVNIQSNLANANAHITDINFRNIITEARTCMESDLTTFELDEVSIHISTRYLKARLLLNDIKIGEILSQKNINLDSIKNDMIDRIGKRKTSFISFISKPFDSMICNILNKKLAEKYESMQDELLNKITQLTNQLAQKISESGIDLKVSEINIG